MLISQEQASKQVQYLESLVQDSLEFTRELQELQKLSTMPEAYDELLFNEAAHKYGLEEEIRELMK